MSLYSYSVNLELDDLYFLQKVLKEFRGKDRAIFIEDYQRLCEVGALIQRGIETLGPARQAVPTAHIRRRAIHEGGPIQWDGNYRLEQFWRYTDAPDIPWGTDMSSPSQTTQYGEWREVK